MTVLKSIAAFYLGVGITLAIPAVISNVTYIALHGPYPWDIPTIGLGMYTATIAFQGIRIVVAAARVVTWPLVVASWLSGDAELLELLFSPWYSAVLTPGGLPAY